MGVTTTADEHLAKAGEAIREAIQHLNEIVIGECWGHDEYSQEYTQKIEEVYDELRAVKKKLNR